MTPDQMPPLDETVTISVTMPVGHAEDYKECLRVQNIIFARNGLDPWTENQYFKTILAKGSEVLAEEVVAAVQADHA